jgi:hypothetical protein
MAKKDEKYLSGFSFFGFVLSGNSFGSGKGIF